jgi:hypothetical protein
VRIAGEHATAQNRPQLIVLDELPFLTDHSPELPGVLQWLYDAYGPMGGGGRPPVRLIACGSALSVMSDLLAEKKALSVQPYRLRRRPARVRGPQRGHAGDTGRHVPENPLISAQWAASRRASRSGDAGHAEC